MARGMCHSLDSPLEAMLGPASRSLTHFSRHPDEPATDASASATPSVFDAATELPSPTSELPDAEASTATTSTQRAATISSEHAVRPPLKCPNHARCTNSRKPYWWSLFEVWFDWPFCVAMPHQVYHSWSRKSCKAARAVEFHAW
jgi:hypothetical protein